jgi:WD40 repeat protein
MGPVAFSPDGKILATADEALPSFAGTIYLWNLASRKVIATLTDPHSQGVNSVAFSPDGKTLAAADINGRTYLWNTATHRITATLTDPYAGINWVAFSPDGKTLATAGGAGSVYLWSIASKNIVATLTTPHTNGVNSVAFSPDGKTLVTTVTPIEKTVTGSKGSIGYLWNIATRSVIGTVSDPGGQEERDATFSPDGKTLATADDNGSAYLWG